MAIPHRPLALESWPHPNPSALYLKIPCRGSNGWIWDTACAVLAKQLQKGVGAGHEPVLGDTHGPDLVVVDKQDCVWLGIRFLYHEAGPSRLGCAFPHDRRVGNTHQNEKRRVIIVWD